MEDRVSNGALVKGMIAKSSRRHGIEGWSSEISGKTFGFVLYHVTKLLLNDLQVFYDMILLSFNLLNCTALAAYLFMPPKSHLALPFCFF